MKLIRLLFPFLLLTAALAWGQAAEVSFPQAANPALTKGHLYLPLVVGEQRYTPTIPTAMAEGRVFVEATPPSVLDWGPKVETGSPFPTAASLYKLSGAEQTARWHEPFHGGSPFPMDASPARW